MRDRAVGALVGLGVGDAVGTTLEFRRPGSFAPIDDMVGGGPFALPPGAWTDDTSLAMCLAESIVDIGGLDPADQLRRYLLWRDRGYWSSTGACFDIGSTTSRALARFAATGAAVDPNPDDDLAANGSLMRLAPVPVRWHADIAEAAERSGESSRPTHPARRPTDACRVLGAMIAALIQGVPADDVLAPDFWQYGPLDPEVEEVARGSWRARQPPAIRGSGYSVAALEAALWAVGGADGFRSAVLRAANLGDDADTTAAIAGQLAGARWGHAGIPAEWRGKIFRAARITALADCLYECGAGAEPDGWPHDDFLHAWWVAPGSVLAGEFPGHADTDRAAEKVNLLVDHGIRTFVDLTTPHDELTHYAEHVAGAAADRRLDLRHVRHPIPDFGVVGQDDYSRIVATITAATERGAVYVHCWGGVGRTGTVVGCMLIDGGLGYDAALARMAELRAGTGKATRPCPENDAQLDVLRRRAAGA
jgi:ADP-ribosyl-[dinitrogen reductase] hydrolase